MPTVRVFPRCANSAHDYFCEGRGIFVLKLIIHRYNYISNWLFLAHFYAESVSGVIDMMKCLSLMYRHMDRQS